MARGFPLRYIYRARKLDMSIGDVVLAKAAEMHPEFWQPEADVNAIRVIDRKAFAAAIDRALNDEEEDGSTLFTRMLDEAIKKAVENGCEGIDWEHFDKVTADAMCATVLVFVRSAEKL